MCLLESVFSCQQLYWVTKISLEGGLWEGSSSYLQDMGLCHLWKKAYDKNEQLRWSLSVFCLLKVWWFFFHVTSENNNKLSNILNNNWTFRISYLNFTPKDGHLLEPTLAQETWRYICRHDYFREMVRYIVCWP